MPKSTQISNMNTSAVPASILTAGNNSIKDDGSALLGFYSGVTENLYIDASGRLVFLSDSLATGALYNLVAKPSSNAMIYNVPTSKSHLFQVNLSTKFSIAAAGVTNLGGVVTVGFGASATVAYAKLTAQGPNGVTVTSYTMEADGMCEITMWANITTGLTTGTTLTCDYTDINNNARTLTIPFLTISGAWAAPQSSTGSYSSATLGINAKNATVVTLSTVGANAVGVYDVGGSIKRVG